MKAFTDIEQSKKLAEILPVESADMMWDDWSLIDEGWKLNVGYRPEIEKDYGRKCYPAWSLAALLDQLEDVVCDEDGNEWELVLKKENVQYDIYYLNICGEQDNIELDRFYDDLVDCCYEMILKLKEKDLI